MDQAGDQSMTPRHDPDVVVIGAGPAGATAACVLGDRGHRVLLIDRASFPRAKVCGCCLAPGGQGILRSLGLGDLVEEGVPLDTTIVHGAGRSTTLDFRGSVTLSRERLDAALIEAARRRHVEFLPRTSAVVTAGDEVELRPLDASTAPPPDPLRPKAIVVADGLGGRALDGRPEFRWRIAGRNRFGVGTLVEGVRDAPRRGELLMLTDRAGYLGVATLEDGRVDLAAALHPERTRLGGGPAATCARILKDAGLVGLADAAAAAKWRGTPSLTRSRRSVAAGRVFCIGDAGGYVEPFTGEGMSWGMEAGVAVAPFVEATLDGRAADPWNRAHARLLSARRRRCRTVAFAIRHPRAAMPVMRLLGRLPRIGRRLAGVASGQSRPPADVGAIG
jgi:flavin-dependent dehydrogenase